MTEKIKVLVVDESVLNRRLISEALAGSQEVEVVAVAATGKIAMSRLDQMPIDLILIDVEMELDDALKTIKRIRKQHPDIGLIALSGYETNRADLAIQALELGALDLVTKPRGEGNRINQPEFRERLAPIVRAFHGKKHARLARELTERRKSNQNFRARIQPLVVSGSPNGPVLAPRSSSDEEGLFTVLRPIPIDIVAIGVSTGGPRALNEVIPQLPGNLGVPIVLVQHMPPLFTEALAGSLSKKSALDVHEAVAGEPVLANHVYIAPGGKHMVVVPENGQSGHPRARIELTSDPPVNSCRPAADVLFRSLANVFGGRTLAVVMTGMGNDGLAGIRLMKAKGCYCLSQSEDTCVVYGMPRAVDEAGLSDEKVPLDQLAVRIEALVGGNKGNRVK